MLEPKWPEVQKLSWGCNAEQRSSGSLGEVSSDLPGASGSANTPYVPRRPCDETLQCSLRHQSAGHPRIASAVSQHLSPRSSEHLGCHNDSRDCQVPESRAEAREKTSLGASRSREHQAARWPLGTNAMTRTRKTPPAVELTGRPSCKPSGAVGLIALVPGAIVRCAQTALTTSGDCALGVGTRLNRWRLLLSSSSAPPLRRFSGTP